MQYYRRLLVLFFKNSILAELEYRANLIVNIFMSLFWFAWAIIGVLVFFSYTDRLGGWTLPEVLIVSGMYRGFNGFMEGVLRPNIRAIVDHIRKGTLDFVLIKPVNSQFLATLRYFSIWRLSDVFLGLLMVGYGLYLLHHVPQWWEIALFFFLSAAALFLLYSLWLLLMTLSFWLVKADNLVEVLFGIYETSRVPVTAFPGWIQYIFTFVIPLAFVTTVPAAALISKLTPDMVVWSMIMSGLLFWLSTRFWHFALRFYSSASS